MKKLIKSTGCTKFYTRLDNKDILELSDLEQAGLIMELTKMFNIDRIALIDIIIDNYSEEYEYDDKCEQCGDTVYRQIINFEE
jgi:hypothetical protein